MMTERFRRCGVAGMVVGLLVLGSLLTVFATGAAMHENSNPSSIDLRPVFANWGLPVRLQGGRGTCSVFTVTSALEYALASQQRHGTPVSVEDLNWAANQATKTGEASEP